ncbi:hypothetical protein [Halorubrum trueperi]|uniref:Uncharacterized protein n=1 Tax=Halorubrum trueperi TaxID=2004704 RepID=A0ABD5UKZ3_9EURY
MSGSPDPTEAADPIEAIVDSPVPDPAAVLGRVPTGTTLRSELAAAARSLGRSSSISGELFELHERVASIEAEPVDLVSPRRRVAEAGGEESRLKERVAALRGDVRARREMEADADGALADLESAAAALSSAQTERIAAEQALERARERAASARDERERRLALRDRLRNRRRDARRELAIGVYPEFREALSGVPGGDPADAGAAPSEYDGPRIAASLAAVRLADLDGSVTLGEAASSWLTARDGSIAPASVIDGEPASPDGLGQR